ncbi:ras-related protein Rap1 [Condylostylus longicornis]|uniref:ras-related protein Rap1 n=1 Tax=Condylostylus longicornis TaxID=2530218 RepID=UPI00244E1FA0|nr:ras-related protein Rap1 [Condylostylus longicornis]
MKPRHLRRRFSLQPSFMKDDHSDEKKRDKVSRSDAADDSVGPTNARHKIVVMGSAKVGKTSIITQFLYNQFPTKYKRTVEEMHQGNFSLNGVNLILDILDTSGSYEFPAMRALSISSAEAFILVYDVTDTNTYEEVRAIRDQIHEIKGTTAVPIVVVGNKIDLAERDENLREVEHEMTENVVTVDWENGFVEASALKNQNITQIFKELLSQAKITYNLSPALRRRRRQSLPPNQMGHNNGHGTPTSSAPPSATHVPSASQLQHLQKIQERSLGGKRNSCVIS